MRTTNSEKKNERERSVNRSLPVSYIVYVALHRASAQQKIERERETKINIKFNIKVPVELYIMCARTQNAIQYLSHHTLLAGDDTVEKMEVIASNIMRRSLEGTSDNRQ